MKEKGSKKKFLFFEQLLSFFRFKKQLNFDFSKERFEKSRATCGKPYLLNGGEVI